MWRFFIFLVSIASMLLVFPVRAEKIQSKVDGTDSPWVQLELNGWVLEIDGVGRKETIVLISTPYALHFTTYTPCLSNEYSEVYTWDHGQRYAKGVDCEGKRVRRPTTDWQGWINPLPFELREHTVLSAPSKSSAQKKK